MGEKEISSTVIGENTEFQLVGRSYYGTTVAEEILDARRLSDDITQRWGEAKAIFPGEKLDSMLTEPECPDSDSKRAQIITAKTLFSNVREKTNKLTWMRQREAE